VSEPFSDFGSTVGNDAGMNLWREFAPTIQQMLKSHAPKFVTKIEARIGPALTCDREWRLPADRVGLIGLGFIA